jgi:hypothetical protein
MMEEERPLEECRTVDDLPKYGVKVYVLFAKVILKYYWARISLAIGELLLCNVGPFRHFRR